MESHQNEQNDNANEMSNDSSSPEEETNQDAMEITADNVGDEKSPLQHDDPIAIYIEQAKPYLKQSQQFLLSLSQHEINNVPVSAIFFIGTSLTALVDKFMPFKIIFFIMKMILNFFLSIIGTTIAIGLGIGFGAHIYEILDKHSYDRAKRQTQANKQDFSNEKYKKSYPKSNYLSPTSENGDASYYALMARSGYPQPSKSLLLRGQIRPINSLPLEMDYNIVGVRAATTMKQMWPNLPHEVSQEFGKLIDYLVRDYVVSWFGSVDGAIVYRNPANEKQKVDETIDEDKTPGTEKENETSTEDGDDSNIPQRIAKPDRILTLSTSSYKAAPFLQMLTSALSHLIGQLCTTATDNVNVVDLILIKVVKAMTKTLKHYRRARKVALLRQTAFRASKQNQTNYDSSNSIKSDKEISEIAITKELLISNKLHKAITFGLDVPSLLFADPKGIKAPSHTSKTSQQHCHESIEDSVLHDRLYNTPLLAECELDYNRVISNKICRKIVPASDLSSPMIKSFAVEVVAGSLLSPIMGFFVPEVINGYLVQGLESYIKSSDSEKNTSHEYVRRETYDEVGFDSFVGDSHSDETNQNKNVTNEEDFKSNHGKNDIKNSKKTNDLLKSEDTKANDLNPDVNDENSYDDESINDEIESRIHDMNDEFDNDENIENGEFENDDDDIHFENIETNRSETDQVLPLLTLAVIDVQNYGQNLKDETGDINWEHESCKGSVCHLVVVIEAALQHGRKVVSQQNNENIEETGNRITAESLFGTSLIDFLMDMTMNIDAFEKSLIEKEAVHIEEKNEVANQSTVSRDLFKHESSTLRTMIVAWFQTGDIYNAIRVFTSSKKLRTYFYNSNAFFRDDDQSRAFCNQLKLLDGMDILVDTMAVLEADNVRFDSRDVNLDKGALLASTTIPKSIVKAQIAKNKETANEPSLMKQAQSHLPGQHQITMLASNMKANMNFNTKRLSRWVAGNNPIQALENEANATNDNLKMTGLLRKTAIKDYLDFHRNADWTHKLRVERAQRLDTWKKATISSAMTATGKYKMIESVCCDSSREIHRDLHYFSRVIYSSTVSIVIEEKVGISGQTNFLIETVSARRMLEVPDDDSSFLLRAQARPLKPLRIWKDDKDKTNDFRIYSAYYEEPVTHPVTKRFNGGKQIRHCYLRYFINDRSATVSPPQNKPSLFEGGTRQISIAPNTSQTALPEKIRKESTPCQKVLQRATSMSTVMMMGNLMELSDFSGMPRNGKAIDYVYKMGFFEKPVTEILGKRFFVQDGNIKGTHRADASALELSDASMTAAIIISGESDPKTDVNNSDDVSFASAATPSLDSEISGRDDSEKHLNEMPIIRNKNGLLSVKIRVKNSGKEKKDLVKMFRPSFIRALLLVTSARQEAQLQCLIWGVKNGSARKATRARTEGLLQPTLSLLDFANSKGRNKESILIRNLKFGSSHIEREKLIRSRILNPRYPTFLRGLNAKIEGWVKSISDDDGSVTFSYRIRCIALTEVGIFGGDKHNDNIIDNHDNENVERKEKDDQRRVYKEEWVIMRTFREFMTLHKHLKTQMSTSAATGGTTQRFAAATAAVLTIASSSSDNNNQRKGLLLSLAHAAKLGALGVSRKSLDKRTEILDDYLKHLLASHNLLRRSSEVLQFLGADTPLESNHPKEFIDSQGRSEFRRMKVNEDLYPEIGASHLVLNDARKKRDMKKKTSIKVASASLKQEEQKVIKVPIDAVKSDSNDKGSISSAKNNKGRMDLKKMAHYAKLKRMCEAVKLSDTREIIFEFIRHLFDLDNATFFRSRVVSALRTMSLVVTSSQEFHKVLLQMHLKYVNGKYIGSMVKSLYDSLWPNGVWYTAGPPMTQKEKDSLEIRSKEVLFEAFPEKVKTILGQEISDDGLSVLHEMLQNKVVLKSLGYMIMDTVWLEIFPELSDVLSGTEAVDGDE